MCQAEWNRTPSGRSSTKSIARLRPVSSAGWNVPRFSTTRTTPMRAAGHGCARWPTNGWLRACVPGVYGGIRADLDVRTLCLARERLAHRSALADFAFAMQGLGAGPLALFGTPNSNGGICRRSSTAAASPHLHSPNARPARTSPRWRRARDAKGSQYVLDGEKTWISNAGLADLYVVFARTGDGGTKGLTAFAVDASTPGCTVAERIETISPHPLGTVRFEAVRVPANCRVGEEGEGFQDRHGDARRLSQQRRRSGARFCASGRSRRASRTPSRGISSTRRWPRCR